LDSLSSTPTIRSNTGGGGPSIDSNATVAPPAIAIGPLAPPPAQPPKPQAIASSAAAMAARDAIRRPVAVRYWGADVCLIVPMRYR